MSDMDSNSVGSVASKKVIQRYIGEVREDLNEHTLERAASFAGSDFALELREDKLLLYAIRGGISE